MIKQYLYFTIRFLGFILFLSIISNWNSAKAQYLPLTSFNTSHGLGDITVYTMYQSPFTGDLWFGTRNGATRYNGAWKNFILDSYPAGNRVRAIVQDDYDRILFGTEQGVKVYFNGTIVTDIFHTLANQQIRVIKKDDSGRLWFGTSDGIFCFHPVDSSWSHYYTDGDSLLHNTILAIEFDSSDVWIGTSDGGIYRLKDFSQWDHFEVGSTMINDLFKDAEGRIWAATEGARAYYFDRVAWVPFGEDTLYRDISAIAQDWDGDLWFATKGQGVMRFDSTSRWDSLTTKDGLPHNWILDVLEDSYRNMWFSTQYAGVCRYDGSWRRFLEGNGPGFEVKAIEKDDRGNIWFGCYGNGIYKYDGTNFEQILFPSSQNKIYAIEKSRDGIIWFGTLGDGIRSYNGIDWNTYNTSEYPLPNDNILYLLEDSKESLWFGTLNGGVTRYQPGSNDWRTFTVDSGLADNIVQAIYEDHEGILWFGTNKGISYYDGEKMESFRKNSINGIVKSITEDEDYTLWIATQNSGVIRILNDRSTIDTLTTGDGLASNEVYSVVYDQNTKRIWLGTSEGVNSVIRQNTSYLWESFNTTNSDLPSNSLRAIYLDMQVNHITGDTSSFLWFGTKKGAARYIGAAFPPETYILTPNGITFLTANPGFEVNAKDNLTHASMISYAFKLFQIDRTEGRKQYGGWSDFSFENIIRVPELKDGQYEIWVRAKDSDGNIDPSPAKITFSIDTSIPVLEIYSPANNQRISKEFVIEGTVFDNNLKRYDLDYWCESQTEWSNAGIIYPKSNNRNVATADTLAIWDTMVLPDPYGKYQLRLSAEDSSGHLVSIDREVLVDQLQFDQTISPSGGFLKTSYQSRYISLYIPPESINELVNIEITTLDIRDEDIVQSGFFIDSTSICFEIKARLKTGEELKQLNKIGTITIHDPIFAYSHEKKLTLYFKSTAVASDWIKIGGTIDFVESILTASFNSFGKYIVMDENITIAGLQLLTEGLNCQPRVFSTITNELPNETRILFSLKTAGTASIKIYNVSGRLIKELVSNQTYSSGENAISWDGTNDEGEKCVSGLYIVHLQLNREIEKFKTVAIVNN